MLEKEKADLELKMSDAAINYDDLQAASNRVGEILVLLEAKELRWLELSEMQA